MVEPIGEKKIVIQGSFGKFQSFSTTLDLHRTQVIRTQDTLFSVEIYKAIRLVYRYPPITVRNVEVSLVWRVWTKKVFIFLLQKLGCDLILNSTAKEDKCRVCNGIGENCKTHKGVTTDVGDGELYFKNQNNHNITIGLLQETISFSLGTISTHFKQSSSLPRRRFQGSSYFFPPHKRLLNRGQHSFPTLSQSRCTFQILES